jgi:uroporphyrinogen-III synthase
MMPDRPLEGRVIVVTRARDDASSMTGMLEERGAQPLVAPAIELAAAPAGPLQRAVASLAAGEFDWVVFTSTAGVEAVFRRMDQKGSRAEEVRASVAAVGEGTAKALRDRGVEPALIPSTFTTDALARAMPRGSGRVLLARADLASNDLESALARKGWTPVRVDAYRTRMVKRLPNVADRAIREGRVDAVTFTSASTVLGFMGASAGAMESAPRRPRVVCIGPVTSKAARIAGLTVDAVARPHTIEGVVAALERLFRGRPRRSRAATPRART